MIAVGESITRHRAAVTGEDRYGNDVVTWTDLDIDGCGIAPRESSDADQPGRAAVIVGLTVYAPTGADIAQRDRITARGDLYEIDGDIADWQSPNLIMQGGLVVNLRRVEG